MNVLKFESLLGKQMMAADEAILNKMVSFNLAKMCMQLAETTHDVWDDVGFEKDSISFSTADTGRPNGMLICKDPEQLGPLADADYQDLAGELESAIKKIGLDRFLTINVITPASKNMARPEPGTIWLVLFNYDNSPTRIRELYKFWKDLEARGARELGI